MCDTRGTPPRPMPLAVWLPLSALLAAAPALASVPDDTFCIAPGEIVHYGDLLSSGSVLGRTGRVLVGLDDDRHAPFFAATLAAGWPGTYVVALPGGLLRVTPAPGADDLALARALARLDDVEFAVPDLLLPLTVNSAPADPFYPDEWHLENSGQSGTADVDVDADLAWQFATGAGQTIAILDTGTQPDHPDLRVTMGYDYVDHDEDSTPDYADASGGPHGTGTAGIAAASGNNGIGVAGVAFDADIYAIRLIGGATSEEDVYNAFVEAVDAGSGVLSNSWGYGSCDPIYGSSVFTRMFRYAERQGRDGLGSVVVFAAGNEGCDIAENGMLNMDTPVVVAALESTDVRSSYSNYGDTVDVAAPTSLLTTDWTSGGYGSYDGEDGYVAGFNGTSGAAPVVAGVVALMLEANPRITAAAVREVLCQTAVKVDLEDVAYDAEGRNPYYGCGRINAGAAVAAVANQAPGAVTMPADGTAPPGPGYLSWGAAEDPDNDALRYIVRWSMSGPWPSPSEEWPTTDTGPSTSDTSTDTSDTSSDTGDTSRVETGGETGGSDTGGTDTGPAVQTSGEVTVSGVLYVPPVLFVDGDVVTWTVTPVDPWGEGSESAPVTITFVGLDTPEDTSTGGPKRGCSSTGSSPSLALLLAGLVVVRRTR